MSMSPIEAYLLQLGLLFGATYLLWRTLKSASPFPDIDSPDVANRHLGLQNMGLNKYELEIAREIVSRDELAASGGFESIGGLDKQISDIQKWVINALERPEYFSHSKLLQRPSSILLYGPPGSGKTMLARAIALRANATFINVDPAALFRPYVGSTEGLIRGLFSLARKLAPTIIFMDEIDGILSSRGNGHNANGHWSNTMKTQILQEWDGLNSWSVKDSHHYGTVEEKNSSWVLIIGATNRPSSLDPAVLRRMPRQIEVPLPDEINRVQILKKLLESEHVCPNLDYELIAKKTPGYSGSDLKELCREALMIPLTTYIDEKSSENVLPITSIDVSGDPTESDPSNDTKALPNTAGSSLTNVGLPYATTEDFIKALSTVKKTGEAAHNYDGQNLFSSLFQ